MSKIAVILPIFKNDKLEYIKEAINSILNQSYRDYELLIAVDGPIMDNVFTYLNQIDCEKIHINYNKKNRGLPVVLNELINYCIDNKFKIIARMDADDISHPNRLLIQLNFLKSNLDVFAVGCQAYIIDKKGRIIGEKDTPGQVRYKILKRKSDVIHPSVMFRKEFFDLVGFYNQELFQSQDYDLWFRADREKVKVINVKERLYYLRYDDSLVQRRKNAQKYVLNIKKEYLKPIDYIYLIPNYLIKFLPGFVLKYILLKKINFRKYLKEM